MKNKIKLLFMCGIIALTASCQNMYLTEPKYDGVVYSGTNEEILKLKALVYEVSSSNKYGEYMVSRMEEHGCNLIFDTNSPFSFYDSKNNSITLKHLDIRTLSHEITHLIQDDNGYINKSYRMTKEENLLMLVLCEFDAIYKSNYFMSDNFNNKEFVDILLEHFNYEYYINYYKNNKVLLDEYNPKDLTPLIDKNMVDYDINYVLKKIQEKLK
jgi:hypothetical protein